MNDEVGDVRQLMQAIVSMSEADAWPAAKIEWSLEDIEFADEYGSEHCLCGHPIQEMCWLRNRLNHSRALVGNVCVTRFLGIRSDLIFNCLRRLAKDDTKAMNADTISHARDHGWLRENEWTFLTDTMSKRSLTERQMKWRRALNNRVMQRAGVKQYPNRVVWSETRSLTMEEFFNQ